MLEAIRLAETAIGKDRTCTRAWSVLWWAHGWRIFSGWTQDRAASLEAARRAVEALMALAPNDSRFYLARGQIETFAGNFEPGAADLRKAHELNPNDAFILFVLSWNEAAEGNVAVARELAAQAVRLSPKDRRIGVAHLTYAMAAFIDHDLPQLRASAELAIQSQSTAPIRRVLMIVYAAETGEDALLQTHLEAVQSVAPDFIPSLFRGDYRPFHRPEHMKLLLDSLRKAGLGA